MVGNIEKTCYNRANGSARGGKSGGEGGRGRVRAGYSRFGEGEEEEESEQGHSKALIGEVNMGTGDGDGEDKEWVCDSGAHFHMFGDISLFDFQEPIPTSFCVKKIMGTVVVTHWGVLRLCTDGVGGVKEEFKLQEVLYMPGMKVNIFSL